MTFERKKRAMVHFSLGIHDKKGRKLLVLFLITYILASTCFYLTMALRNWFSLLLRRLRHAGNSFQFCFDFDSFTVVFQLLAGNLLEQSGLGNSFPREGNFPSLILLWPWRIGLPIGAGTAICIASHGSQLPKSNFAFNYKKNLNNLWQSFPSRELNQGPPGSQSDALPTELSWVSWKS